MLSLAFPVAVLGGIIFCFGVFALLASAYWSLVNHNRTNLPLQLGAGIACVVCGTLLVLIANDIVARV